MEGVSAIMNLMKEIKPSVQNSSDQVSMICAALKTNTSITSMNLSDNPGVMKDDQAEALANMLGVNRTIRSIDMSGNNIGARGDTALGRPWRRTTF